MSNSEFTDTNNRIIIQKSLKGEIINISYRGCSMNLKEMTCLYEALKNAGNCNEK